MSESKHSFPIITSLEPNNGPANKYKCITIHGDNLWDVTRVYFGNRYTCDFDIVDSKTISVQIPKKRNSKNLCIFVKTCSYSNGLVYTYTKNNQTGPPIIGGDTGSKVPTITNIVPNSGPINGNNVVTIFGTNLAYITEVLFDNNKAVSINYINEWLISVIAPPSLTAGTVAVTVKSQYGTSNAMAYTYELIPSI
jgi:hypothetical protein